MSSPNNPENLTKWKTRAFKVWAVIGGILLILGAIKLCGILHEAVFAVVVAGLTVFLLHGIVDALERRKIKRIWGTLISMLGAFIVIGGGLALLTPQIVIQVSDFAAQVPGYAQDAQDFVYAYLSNPNLPISSETLMNAADQAEEWLYSKAGEAASVVASGVWNGAVGFGGGLLAFCIAILAAFWVLIDLPKISKELRSLFSEEHQDDIDVIAGSFGKAIYGWFKSTLICAVISGVATGVALWICGIPYATLLGIITGVTYVIPYLGHIIAGIIVGIIAFTVSPLKCILAVAVFIVIANLVGNLLSPRLMKETVNVNPALILIALMIGSGLAGPIGMLAAIPVAAAAQSIFVSYFEARTGKKLYSPDGALFQDKGAKTENTKASASEMLAGIWKKNKNKKEKPGTAEAAKKTGDIDKPDE